MDKIKVVVEFENDELMVIDDYEDEEVYFINKFYGNMGRWYYGLWGTPSEEGLKDLHISQETIIELKNKKIIE